MEIRWLNENSKQFLETDYLLPGQTVENRIQVIGDAAEKILGIQGFSLKVQSYISKGWISPSTPIWANFGTDRGLPISCFNSHYSDSIIDILSNTAEVGVMTKVGGGTSGYLGELRGRGAVVKNNGTSTGSKSFLELIQATTNVIKQGAVRRGFFAAYINIFHQDIEEWLKIKTEGDPIQDMNWGVCVPTWWLKEMRDGDSDKRKIWAKVIQRRFETGLPYIFFNDNANNGESTPECYKDKNLIKSSNLCVSGDTKILTNFGYTEIQDLEGEFVNVWNGNEWSEVQIIKTGENKELLNIVTDSGYELKCTPYHKFYIQIGYERGTGDNKLKIIEKRASELESGDKLIKFDLPIIQGNKNLKYAYTQGFYSGDGCNPNDGRNSSKMLYLYGEKKALLPYIEVRNKYTYGGRNSKPTDDKAITTSKTVDRIICYVPEDLNDNKSFVPDSSYTIESRLKWLAGYLDADGTVTNYQGSQTLQASSVNKRFLLDLQLMLQTLGCDSKVTFSRKEGKYELPANDGTGLNKLYNCKEVNRILINGNSLYKLSELGLTCHRLKWELKKPNRECSRLVKVNFVEELPDLYDTYCFEEPKRHLGMFNGLLTGQCSEIFLPSTETESFVCDLCSLNDLYFEEWKETDCVEVATFLLDAVMTEFIEKASSIRFMERAVLFAKNHRALGIGRLGYHSLLQSKMIPFESMDARAINIEIQKTIQKQSLEASRKLSERFSECEWTKGLGRRNTTTCVTGDTKILTKCGQIEISSLVGKEVQVWNGSNWSKTIPFETGINNIYKVSFSNGMSLKCTDNHKFLISTPQRDSKNRFSNKTLEVSTLELRVGDCVPKFPIDEADGSDKELDYAYTSGLFCGDGSTNNSRNGKYPRKELRLYGGKANLAEYVDWKNGKTWGKDCVRGYLPNNVLDKFIVPHEFSIKSKTEWLCGLIDSDGSFSSTGISISTKNESFAVEVGLLIQSLGGEIMVRECTRKGGYSNSNNKYYSINISLFSCGKIFHEIKPKRVNIVAIKPTDTIGKGHWVYITKIENLKEKEKTYCFTEKEYNCGVFSGILTKQCAIAPTTSSGFIMQVSQSIEPYNSNYYTKDLAKGKFTIKNKYLEKTLEKYGKNTDEIWNSIMKQHGSVLHLDFLSEEEKHVFKTAREISQREIIVQAAQRQKYIDQGQSLNLFITADVTAKEVNELILLAHDMGIKSLYYQHNVNAASEFAKQLNCIVCE